MGNRVLVQTLGFDHMGLGAIFDFLGKTLKTYFHALELIQLALIDVIK